ncbi:MAG: hypothetical protein KDD43_07695 [Bdellovibrionales bacterium]|nr:hypothetical protein [Bdellovibrionales bacterium]
MTSRVLFTILITATGVFGIGYYWGHRQAEMRMEREAPPAAILSKAVPNESTRKLEDLKAKFVRLSEEDYAEYLQIKDERAKYQKADEILGKIILLFLADLGVRVSKDQLSFARQSTSEQLRPTEAPRVDDSIGGGEQLKKSGLSIETAEIGGGKHLAEKSNTASEKDLDEIYSDKEVEDFLNKVTVNNLFDQLRQARSLNRQQLRSLRGTFVGQVHFDDVSKQRWDVKLIFQGREQDGELTGKAKVELSKDGKPFSTSRSSGNLGKNFSSLPGTSRGILVEANGGEGYFQLYAPQRLNSLVGLYYHREKVGEFKRTGVVTLFRQ